jgi:hypothetical protein
MMLTSRTFGQTPGDKAVPKTGGSALWSQYDRADAGF